MQLSLYKNFCYRIHKDPLQPDTDTLVAYIEFLSERFISHRTVLNYVSVIGYWHSSKDLQCLALQKFRVKELLRSVPRSIRHVPKQATPLTVSSLRLLVQHVLTLPHGVLFAAVFVMAFFLFLRASNIAPEIVHKFDKTRHFTRGDVHFDGYQLVVSLKWTKTLQLPGQPVILYLPMLSDTLLDPVTRYLTLLRYSPTLSPAQPLFSISSGSSITLTNLRATFQRVLALSDLSGRGFTLHSFRSGGSSEAKRHGADLEEIRRHGVWASESVYGYLRSKNAALPSIVQAFRNMVQ